MAVGLDISVTRFRTSRRYPHGEKAIVFTDKGKAVEHIPPEGFVVNHHLVSRNGDECSLRIELRYAVPSPRYARRRSATYGFGHDMVVGNVGQLLLDKVEITDVGVDENMVFGHNCGHAVIGLLQLRTACSKEINKLFGVTLPAARP